jgi:hypothetical protein
MAIAADYHIPVEQNSAQIVMQLCDGFWKKVLILMLLEYLRYHSEHLLFNDIIKRQL